MEKGAEGKDTRESVKNNFLPLICGGSDGGEKSWAGGYQNIIRGLAGVAPHSRAIQKPCRA